MMQDPSNPPAPWWTHGFLWLVISGPALVVVAAIATVWLAVLHPDPVTETDYYRRGMEINKRLAAAERARLPAVQGRNHAATPAPR